MIKFIVGEVREKGGCFDLLFHNHVLQLSNLGEKAEKAKEVQEAKEAKEQSSSV